MAALATYGLCQTGCNTAWVGCCAALGYTAGTFTMGGGVPAALASCSAAQGTCMMSCAAMTGLVGVATSVGTAAASTAVVSTVATAGAVSYATMAFVGAGAMYAAPATACYFAYKYFRGPTIA